MLTEIHYTCIRNRSCEYMQDSIRLLLIQLKHGNASRKSVICLLKFGRFLAANAIFENIVVSTSNPRK